jgi:FixJ family two-component response regulator
MTTISPRDPDVTVHVVEDDESSRIATTRVLTMSGYVVRAYPSAAEFLAAPPAGPGCIVLDLQLPGLNGLEAQQALVASANPLPIVFLSGHGDVPKSVKAMKAGAVDFLAKPVEPEILLEAVSRALSRDAEDRLLRTRQSGVRARYERLTPREREVFAHLISGQLNKQAAFDLGTTEHTIKVHRRRVMEKFEADSLADLVRFASDLGIAPVGQVK